MIGRLVWFGIGAGVAVWASGKVKGYLRRASPEAISQRVTASVGGAGESARDFWDRVRVASAEREAELRSMLGQPSAGPELPAPTPQLEQRAGTARSRLTR